MKRVDHSSTRPSTTPPRARRTGRRRPRAGSRRTGGAAGRSRSAGRSRPSRRRRRRPRARRGRPRRPDEHDQPSRVQPARLGELEVVGHRAHLLAKSGDAEEHPDQHEDRVGGDRRDRDRAADRDPVGELVEGDVIDAELLEIGARDVLDRVADDEREADRREQQLERTRPPAAQRPPEAELEHDREQRGHRQPEQGGEDDPEAERYVRAEGHVGPERQEVALREVDQPQDPVDEREADGCEREVRPGDEAVHRHLDDRISALEQRDDDSREDDQDERAEDALRERGITDGRPPQRRRQGDRSRGRRAWAARGITPRAHFTLVSLPLASLIVSSVTSLPCWYWVTAATVPVGSPCAFSCVEPLTPT